MDFKKIIKFRIGSEDWEIPLGTLLLLLAITLLLMIGGAYMGFKFGERQFPESGEAVMIEVILPKYFQA